MSISAARVNPPRIPAFKLRHPAARHAAFVALSLGGVALAYQATVGSGPFATAAVLATATAAAMHARLATGRWAAALQVVMGAALLSLLGAAPRLVGSVLVGGLAGSELIARCARRSDVLQAGTWTGVITGLIGLSGLVAAVPVPAGVSLRDAFGALAGGFLSAPLVLTVGPVAEWLFGHTTRLTMSEWLSYEHPLLRELALAAPGTFQHSINVGVLADAAAGAIRADALIARVGGLYHDVGKMRAPEYFIENQHGPNPHDDLDPWESARILRAHVSDGVELIRAHRMGDRIADFVQEHHGTGAMRTLREKADHSGGQGPPDETYRYPGPRPRSRETGIVMMADQVEATARSAPPADAAACDEIVRLTIARIQEEEELADAGLTARDFAAVAPALSRALQAMHHRRRLTYPPSDPDATRRRFSLMPRALARRRAGS